MTPHARFHRPALAGAFLALALAGCGGGGGASTTGGAGPGGTTPPVTQPPETQPPGTPPEDLPPQTSVPTPTYPTVDPKLAAFDRINTIRAQAGLGLLAQNAVLDRAAQAHADYMAANNAMTHSEVPGAAGFTGQSHVERAQAAGYAGQTAEGISLTVPATAIDLLMGLPYQRIPLVSFRVAEVGLGVASFRWDVTYGYRDGAQQGAPAVNSVIWPLDGAVNVPRGQSNNLSSDMPHPIPESSFNQFGYAVSLSVDDAKVLSVSSFTLAGPSGAVDVKLLSAGTDPNIPNVRHYAAIIGRLPLQAATKYTASFTGAIDGVAHSRTWSFTTGN